MPENAAPDAKKSLKRLGTAVHGNALPFPKPLTFLTFPPPALAEFANVLGLFHTL